MSGSLQGKRILIMAGGTGGHVFPALAVAEALHAEGCRVDWLGTPRGIENDVVAAAGFRLHHISVTGVRGKGPLDKILAPVRLALAVVQAWGLFGRLRPDAVLGMGGFASGPGGLVSRLRRIPLVVHEQNAVAGTTNRWLARWADRVLTAFPDVFPQRPDARLTGNPVRESMTTLPAPERRGVGAHEPLRLLVLGGSQGARALNLLMPEALAKLPQERQPEVRHQCGRAHVEQTRKVYSGCGYSAEVTAFIEDMAQALGWADLVVARAGALTVAELAAVGVGSLLVPFPHAIDDHQTRNAEWLAQGRAARVLPQSELTADTLAAALTESLDGARLGQWAQAAKRLGRPDATQAVVAELKQQVEQNK